MAACSSENGRTTSVTAALLEKWTVRGPDPDGVVNRDLVHGSALGLALQGDAVE